MTAVTDRLYTQADRDKEAQDIHRSMRALAARLDSLGLQPEKKEDPRAKAPDGGPRSEAHRFMRAQLTQTVEVNIVTLPGSPEAIIPRAWLEANPKKYVPIVRDVAAPRTRSRLDVDELDVDGALTNPLAPSVVQTAKALAPIPALALGTQSRVELLLMSNDALREMPEVRLLRNAPDSKEALVDAIMSLRAALGG
jgi:hypothetical protein